MVGSWSNKLISELELRPCLWKKENEFYKNKYTRAAATDELAQMVIATADEVKDKIRNLRTTFFQNLKKTKKNGSAGGVQPKWDYFNALSFLSGEEAAAGRIDTIVSFCLFINIY